LSGNGWTMDQTPNSKPVFKTASFAGLDSAFFQNNSLLGTAQGSALSQPFSLVSIWRMATTSSSLAHHPLGRYDGTTSMQTPLMIRTSLAGNALRLGAGSFIDGPGISTIDPHYAVGIVRNASPKLYLDAADVTPVGSVGAGTINRFGLRGAGTGANGFYVAEALVLAGAISDEDRLALDAYVADKYGIPA
jgi:hypothetical protein